LNTLVAITAADQTLGQVEDPAGVVETADVEQPAPGTREDITTIKIRIASDADVIHASELHDMIEMIENVLDRGGLLISNENPNSGNSHHTPG
jgi:hypothetical protein